MTHTSSDPQGPRKHPEKFSRTQTQAAVCFRPTITSVDFPAYRTVFWYVAMMPVNVVPSFGDWGTREMALEACNEAKKPPKNHNFRHENDEISKKMVLPEIMVNVHMEQFTHGAKPEGIFVLFLGTGKRCLFGPWSVKKKIQKKDPLKNKAPWRCPAMDSEIKPRSYFGGVIFAAIRLPPN